MNEPKQVLLIRRDLKMRRGKEGAQLSHASIAFITKRLRQPVTFWERVRFLFSGDVLSLLRFTAQERQWFCGPFIKIVLKAQDEESLLNVYDRARQAGLEAHLIRDAGRTEFDGIPTYTAVGIGPDSPDKIDPVTGEMELY